MQTKVKGLAPSLKEKKRYINIKTISPESNPKSVDFREVMLQTQKTLGVFDSAGAGLQLVEYKANQGIIRVNNEYIDKAKAALMLIKIIDGKKIIIKTTNTSGTLRKAKEKMNR
jgi:ribonuclease P/MRP protein subunit POP5